MPPHAFNDRSNDRSPVGSPRREVPTVLHAFLVTFLALFFCGLIVWRVPIQGYLVTAEVGVKVGAHDATLSAAPGTAAVPSGRRLALVASGETIDRAMQFADARAMARSSGGTVLAAAHSASAVRKNLHFRDSGSDLGADRIVINFRGRDREWSVAFVQELVRQLRTAANATPCHQDDGRAVRQASWAVDGARHYERKARLDLESNLAAHFERLRTEPNVMQPPDQQPSEDVAESRSNSQRKRLQAELSDLTGELSELLNRFTPSHPSVQDVTWRIEEARRRLKRLPQFSNASYRLPDKTSSGRGAHQSVGRQRQPRSGDRSSSGMPPSDLAESGSGGVKYGQASSSLTLLEELQSAADFREQAEDNLRAALVCRDIPNATVGLYSKSVGEPTQEVHTIGGRPSVYHVGLIGLMAVVVAALVAQTTMKPAAVGNSATRVRARRRSSSPTLANQVLRVDDPPQPSTEYKPLIRRRQLGLAAVKASEWFLVLLVVALLVAFLAESPLLPRFASNPFGTLAEAITHAWR